MTALSAPRDTKRTGDEHLVLPVAASVTCYQGGIAAVIASGTGAGNVTPGATATTLRGVGVFEETVTNGATAGAVSAKVRRGVFGPFANSGSTDAITNADIGADCYIVDDQTVAKTNGSNTRSVAGKVHLVDAAGVWVRF